MQLRTNLLIVALAAAALLLGTAGTAQAALIAHWAFDDASTSQVAKDSAGIHDGRLGSTESSDANDPTPGITGAIGTAYGYDGSNDFVYVAHHPNLFGMRYLTLSAWFFMPVYPTQDRELITKLTTSADRCYLLGLGTSGVRVFLVTFQESTYGVKSLLYSIPDAVDKGYLTYGAWQHLAGVYNGDTREGWLYLNGREINYADWGTGSDIIRAAGTAPVTLGGRSPTGINSWYSAVDDLGILNEVLSPPKIRSLYTTPGVSGLKETGLYNLSNMYKLFGVYDDPTHTSTWTIGSLTWRYLATMPEMPDGHSPGDAWSDGTYYYIQLGASDGISTIPEPGTLALLAGGLLGLLCYAWRRKK